MSFLTLGFKCLDMNVKLGVLSLDNIIYPVISSEATLTSLKKYVEILNSEYRLKGQQGNISDLVPVIFIYILFPLNHWK